jgi:hypothetical protein
MKARWTDPALRELLALAALASFGFGSAVVRDASIFAASAAVTLIGVMRRLR